MPTSKPHPLITANRHTGQSGLQIRKLLLANLPANPYDLSKKLGLPVSTCYYYLLNMFMEGKVNRKKEKCKFIYCLSVKQYRKGQ